MNTVNATRIGLLGGAFLLGIAGFSTAASALCAIAPYPHGEQVPAEAQQKVAQSANATLRQASLNAQCAIRRVHIGGSPPPAHECPANNDPTLVHVTVRNFQTHQTCHVFWNLMVGVRYCTTCQ